MSALERGAGEPAANAQPKPLRAVAAPAREHESSLAWKLASSLLLLAVAIAALLFAEAASAENRSLQVVGVQPLDSSASKAGGPRQGAINAALKEGVTQVARELIDEYGPPEAAEGDEASGETGDDEGASPVERALGKDMTPFTRSFRIVDDQGSRPALFPGESKADREYVVVVDVTVDEGRVRDRLAEKGLIAVEDAAAGSGMEIEALGLRHWSGYEAFLALLQSRSVGASEVRPLEFEVGRALVHATVDGDPEDVLARLMAAAPADLEISGRSGGGESPDRDGVPRLEVVVLWTPPAH